MSEGDRQAQTDWAHRYDGYQRLAATQSELEQLLSPARDSYQEHQHVPDWCGVDLLRGWAFFLVRADRHAGGGTLGAEWDTVLAAVRAHPEAGDEEKPPAAGESSSTGRMILPTTFSTEPRQHRDPAFLAVKRARLREPHIAPVNDLVDRIRFATGLDVPYIDPDSGGIAATVLFVLQAPARAAAHGSGMLSADNDDGTAANVWRGYADSGLPRTAGLHWNAVPWYVGTTEKLGPITRQQVADGRQWVREMVGLAPDLRAVVSFGNDARDSLDGLSELFERRHIKRLHSWHPSQRNYNVNREETTRQVREAFAQALIESERPA